MFTLLFFDDFYLHQRTNLSRHVGQPILLREGTLHPHVDPASAGAGQLGMGSFASWSRPTNAWPSPASPPISTDLTPMDSRHQRGSASPSAWAETWKVTDLVQLES